MRSIRVVADAVVLAGALALVAMGLLGDDSLVAGVSAVLAVAAAVGLVFAIVAYRAGRRGAA